MEQKSTGWEWWRKIEHLFHKYERKVMSVSFVFGFLLDNLTLTRIDMWLDLLIIFLYFAIAFLGIALSNIGTRTSQESILGRVAIWAPIIMQFAFGGLLSNFVVFYSRSATLGANWPFLLFLGVMFVGNEFIEKRYQRFGLQMSILFISIFSFSIFYVPIVVNRIGDLVFLASGLVSLLLITFILWLFGKVIPYRVRASRRVLMRSIPAIFLLINIMYFTNLIPPLPLSLKEMGVFHSVERTEDGRYSVKFEDKKWYDFFEQFETYHHINSERVYVYSAVFAPTDLRTKILHHWQYYDAEMGTWKSADKLQFPIYGGRDGGYRGYSFKTNIGPGLWRVDVITERGQLLGRVKFNVITGVPTASLVSNIF